MKNTKTDITFTQIRQPQKAYNLVVHIHKNISVTCTHNHTHTRTHTQPHTHTHTHTQSNKQDLQADQLLLGTFEGSISAGVSWAPQTRPRRRVRNTTFILDSCRPPSREAEGVLVVGEVVNWFHFL